MRKFVILGAAVMIRHASSFSLATNRSYGVSRNLVERHSEYRNGSYSSRNKKWRQWDSSLDLSSSNDVHAPVTVTFETASEKKSIHIREGELLRSALLKSGLSPHNGRSRLINCRGLGTCGTCAVEIYCSNDAAIEPRERSRKEEIRLKFPPHGSTNQSPHLRLACQVQVFDDVIVKKRTGFWGQGTDEVEEAFDAELWFGEFEYLLDDKSPKAKDSKE
eukprot:CCRYP_009329-RA/>CCRYP_009329-RA protein AED:0.00 eAED:0.00 QI:42/-1/1/1/-1/1/1/228/218